MMMSISSLIINRPRGCSKMADSTAPKRRKYSKSKKRNWRKFTDVRDVETYLEDKRREERTGGPAADKPNEELFVISTEGRGLEGAGSGPTGSSHHQLNTQQRKHVLLTGSGERRSGQRRKGIPQAASEAPEDNVHSSDSDSSEREEATVARLKQSRLGRRALHRAKGRGTLAAGAGCDVERGRKGGGVCDVWDGVGDSKEQTEEERVFLQMTGKNKPKLPKTLVHRQPSLLPAVEVSEGGSSYNPSFDDHQDLLRVAVAEEEVRRKEEERVERWYRGVPRMEHLQREHIWLKEISEGLFEDVPSADEGSDQDSDVATYKRPIRADDRRTAKQRRKEQERKEQHVQQVTEKQRRVREGEVFRLKTLKKEVKRDEALLAQKLEKRQKEKAELGRKTLRLGRIRYEEPVTDVKLSSELTGSLRKLQPEGSIARDRYKSLLKRNIIEPRKKVMRHRKYKLKVTEKRSCRMPEDDI